MFRYDVATDSWTVEIGNYFTFSNYLGMAYLPEYDCILLTDPSGITIYDCVAGTYSTPPISGSYYANMNACQPLWVNGKCYVWNNDTNTDKITRMTPSGNPRTGTWTIDALPVDVGNSVTPDAKQLNGTYGRFAFSSVMGVFILMNTHNGSIYFFKPSSL
jgi:hypothetical protein